MRFSQEFSRAQVPHWLPFYVDYEYFKTAVKVTNGKARKLGAAPKYHDIIKRLGQQCHAVEVLFARETKHLQLLRGALKAEMSMNELDSETKSTSLSADRQAVLHSVLKHILHGARALLLFAKVNAEATRRVLAKIDRCSGESNQVDDAFLSALAFYDQSPVVILASWAEQTLLSTSQAGSSPHDLGATSQSAILKRLVSACVQGENSVYRMHRTVELAGMQIQLPRSLNTMDSNKPTLADSRTETWMEILRTEIKYQFENTSSAGDVSSERDGLGRTPLHYAAEYGLEETVRLLLSDQCRPSLTHVVEDADGLAISPLALALSNSHTSVVSILAKSQRSQKLISCEMAFIALQKGDLQTLTQLLALGVDLNGCDSHGRRLLPAAANLSSKHSIRACEILLAHGADVDIKEDRSHRTALVYASINDNSPLVELLLKHGADSQALDARNWSAIEHAAYRGHLEIVAVLERQLPDNASQDLSSMQLLTAPIVRTDLSDTSHIPRMRPHRDYKKETCVWIRLGSNDVYKPTRPLQLDALRGLDHLSLLESESMYCISVCAEEDPTLVYETTLPVMESNVNKPWLFYTKDVSTMRLRWHLLKQSPTHAGKHKLVGSGIVLMGMLNAGIRPFRESLVRDTTIPLQQPATLECLGAVTFSYFWVTPHLTPAHLDVPHFWEFGTGIGGHRGSGKNMIDQKRLQIGENTAQSFMTAVEHGASFIEFDIQMTKDLVPVVYHDFLLSETGTDSPMHTLSYEQFDYLSRSQGPCRGSRPRSASLQSADKGQLDAFRERMSRTYFNKVNGFKSNTRGDFIQERSCSLEQLFQRVPKTVRMNIELKHPMLFETDEWDMELLSIRVDLFVNLVLDKVFEHAAGRTIVFSSFSPEVCIALSTKQRAYPVFFLSKTSTPRGEIRSCCLQQAIHCAKGWGLPGIVAECTPFISCPKLIGYVKSAGLMCTSFGVGNSVPEYAKLQFEGGINAVISDSVRAISLLKQTLPEEVDQAETVKVFP